MNKGAVHDTRLDNKKLLIKFGQFQRHINEAMAVIEGKGYLLRNLYLGPAHNKCRIYYVRKDDLDTELIALYIHDGFLWGYLDFWDASKVGIRV